MEIFGLQELTLLDYPGKVACTVFLPRCDFRCPFCHNWELHDGSGEAQMDDAELLRFLERRKGVLEGVAITGGEPTLQPELPELIRKIKALGYPVKLDTNGNHPEMLEKLLSESLPDYVAMDIKNSPDRYAQTIGYESFDLSRVERSIRLLLSGSTDYEFRTTVVAQLHDADSFRGIAPWIQGAKRYYLQAFTDRDTVPFAGLSAPESTQMQAFAEIVRPYVTEVGLR